MGWKLKTAVAVPILAGGAVAGGNYYLHEQQPLPKLPALTPNVDPITESYFCPEERPNCDSLGALATLGSGGNHLYRSLDQLDDDLELAAIGLEDQEFFIHDGIDNRGVARASVRNATATFENLLQGNLTIEIEEGASTIPMQLPQNIYYDDPTRPDEADQVAFKKWEALYALKINDVYSKEEQLEMWLNYVNTGSGARGMETAASHYYGKSAADLSPLEAATLVSIPNAPEWFEGSADPAIHAERMQSLAKRRNTALWAMWHLDESQLPEEYLAKLSKLKEEIPTEEALREVMAQPADLPLYHVMDQAPYFNADRAIQLGARHVIDMAMDQLGRSGLSGEELTDGLRINLTINEYAQRATVDVANYVGVNENGVATPVVVLKQNGDIMALYAGTSWETTQVNVATMRRPAGSFHKLFQAALHLEDGTVTPTTPLVEDQDYSWKGGDIDNSDYEPEGGLHCEDPCDFAKAFWNSSNPIFLQLMEQKGKAGLEAFRNLMERAGVHSDSPIVASNVLGSAESSLLDNTVGEMVMLGNGGVSVRPKLIDSVNALRGNGFVTRLELPGFEPQQVIKPETSTQLLELARQVPRRGTAARSLQGLSERMEIAGKTGTFGKTGINYLGLFIGTTCMYVDGEKTNITIGVSEGHIDVLEKNLGLGHVGGEYPGHIWGGVAQALKTDQPDCRIDQ